MMDSQLSDGADQLFTEVSVPHTGMVCPDGHLEREKRQITRAQTARSIFAQSEPCRLDRSCSFSCLHVSHTALPLLCLLPTNTKRDVAQAERPSLARLDT